MERRTFTVEGLSCGGCERSVESALSRLDGVSRVAADHGTDTVELVVADDVSEADLARAVAGAGYDLVT